MNEPLQKLDEVDEFIRNRNLDGFKAWASAHRALYQEYAGLVLLISIKYSCKHIAKLIIESNPSLPKMDWANFKNHIGDGKGLSSGTMYNSNSYFSVTPHPILMSIRAKDLEMAELLRCNGFPLKVGRDHAISSMIDLWLKTGRKPEYIENYIDSDVPEDVLYQLLHGRVSETALDISKTLLLPIYKALRKNNGFKLILEAITKNYDIRALAVAPREFLKILPDHVFRIADIKEIDNINSSWGTLSKVESNLQSCYLMLFEKNTMNISGDNSITIGEVRLDCFNEVLERGNPDIYATHEFLELALRIGNTSALRAIMDNLSEEKRARIREIANDPQRSFPETSKGLIHSWTLSRDLKNHSNQEIQVRKRSKMAI